MKTDLRNQCRKFLSAECPNCCHYSNCDLFEPKYEDQTHLKGLFEDDEND